MFCVRPRYSVRALFRSAGNFLTLSVPGIRSRSGHISKKVFRFCPYVKMQRFSDVMGTMDGTRPCLDYDGVYFAYFSILRICPGCGGSFLHLGLPPRVYGRNRFHAFPCHAAVRKIRGGPEWPIRMSAEDRTLSVEPGTFLPSYM